MYGYKNSVYFGQNADITQNYQEGSSKNNIVIGNHVWLGYHSTVLNPTVFGSGCNCGANSLIRGKYSNNCTLVGSIARTIKKILLGQLILWQ